MLRLLASVIIAWSISVIGVILIGEIVENKNVLEEFLIALLCIWVYMGYHGICGYFRKRLKKT
jgi:uncharacterized membrane protein|tara:strand:- start:599 stop:787 length:189 start_codon:yes stop_codon:yes gene_type:complete